MNSSQLELCQERGRVELLWQFQIFYLGILVQLFAINICHFRSLQWRGPQWKSLFWAYEKPHQAKNQFSVKPPSWFSLNMFYWEMGSYFWTLFKSKKKHSNDPLTYSALLRHNGPSSCLLTPCQHIWVIYLGFRVWSLDKPLQELPILTPISIYKIVWGHNLIVAQWLKVRIKSIELNSPKVTISAVKVIEGL